MRRGLDGFFCFLPSSSAVFKLHGGCLYLFGGEIARGKHLFPFRTESLSLSAPMVLGGQPPGRVGRRRSSLKEPPEGRLFLCPYATGPPRSDRLERSGGQSAGSFYAAIRSGTPARSCSEGGAPEARPGGRRS